VSLYITVWDVDDTMTEGSQTDTKNNDVIDEFDYNLVDEPGSDPRTLTILGERPANKTRCCNCVDVFTRDTLLL